MTQEQKKAIRIAHYRNALLRLSKVDLVELVIQFTPGKSVKPMTLAIDAGHLDSQEK